MLLVLLNAQGLVIFIFFGGACVFGKKNKQNNILVVVLLPWVWSKVQFQTCEEKILHTFEEQMDDFAKVCQDIAKIIMSGLPIFGLMFCQSKITY